MCNFENVAQLCHTLIMKKQSPLILSIPKPCKQSWAEMQLSDNGRFCTQCQLAVIDITNMSDESVAQLFRNSTETPCIRALSSQLNRNIVWPPQKQTRFYRIAVALSLVLVSLNSADSIGHPKAPLSEQNALCNSDEMPETPSAEGDSLMIEGVVVDQNNKPVPKASMRLRDATGKMVFADDKGAFCFCTIKGDEGKNLMFWVFANGYETNNFSFSYHELMNAPKLRIELNRMPAQEEEVIMGRGLGNVFYATPYNEELEEKDSLGHINQQIVDPVIENK